MNSVLIDRRKGCSDVCIAFSARDTSVGKFTFFNVVKDLPAHVIFVNDHANNWYLNGTPEFGTQEEFLLFMKKTLADLLGRGGRVFTLGSSMGAYAALYYGSLLQVDRVLALGPESELCIPLGRSVTSMTGHAEGDADITGLSYKDAANVLIISGNNDIVDMYCASRFKTGNPLLDVRLVSNRTHVVAKYLDANFGLASIVRNFFIDGDASFLQRCELSALPPLATARALKQFNEALTLDKQVLIELGEPIQAVADAMPEWSMPPYFFGLIAEAQGRLHVAEAYLQRSVAAQRSLGRAVLKLARIRHADGRHQQALEGLLDLARTNNTWSVTELLSQVWQSLGQLVQAMQILRSFDRSQLKAAEQQRLEKRLAELTQKFFAPVREPRPTRLLDSAAFPAHARCASDTVFTRSSLELADATSLFECGEGCTFIELTVRIGRNARLTLGRGCRLGGSIEVGDGSSVVIGDHLLGHELHIEAGHATRIHIGRDCQATRATVRSSSGYQLRDAVDGPVLNPPQDVVVGDHVWLSDHCLILPGSVLGPDTVVEAGAVVSLSQPDGHCLLAGSPAQVMRQGTSWTSVAAVMPLSLPAELTPETLKQHAHEPEWIVKLGAPCLSEFRRVEASACWVLHETVRALLQRGPALDASELPQLLEVMRHCNTLLGNSNREALQTQADVLIAMGEHEQAATLSWLISSRWPA